VQNNFCPMSIDENALSINMSGLLINENFILYFL
jgi:hypothetical protein